MFKDMHETLIFKTYATPFIIQEYFHKQES